MKKNKKEIEKDTEKQEKDTYISKITFSQSQGESLDLLDIIENFLCQSIVRL